MKKKINFTKVEIENYDGKVTSLSIVKPLSDVFFSKSTDFADFELGRKIFAEGEVELTEKEIESVNKFMEIGGFIAAVKIGLKKQIDNNNLKDE